MGPSNEALALARKLLEGNPQAARLETDLAYELERAGAAWLRLREAPGDDGFRPNGDWD